MNFGDVVFSGVLSEESVEANGSKIFVWKLSEYHFNEVKDSIGYDSIFTRFFVCVFDSDGRSMWIIS